MDPVQKALWYVESHSREPIALEDIARACRISPFHLTRAFAATMGLSLMRYVRRRRLSEAARQLAQGADQERKAGVATGNRRAIRTNAERYSTPYCWRLKSNTYVCVILFGYPVTKLQP